MLDHKVLIGDIDVSNEVISVRIQDQIETDGDPGKISVVLANRLNRSYDTIWPPQKTVITVVLYSWVYRSEGERAAAGGHPEAKYLVAYGHVTDISRSYSEVTITGECGLGHLADALGQDYNSPKQIWASDLLREVLSLHKGLKFKLNYQAHDILYPDGRDYLSETTYQDIIEDIRSDVGAVYYFSEEGVLEFRDPAAIRDVYNLDPYVMNPDDTSSIMGYRNVVHVIGSESLAGSSIDGVETPGSAPIMATARDEESIAELGELVAPTDRAIYLKTQEDCQKRADLLLNYYKLYRNALTKPRVANIVPPLHSKVSYSVFIPISSDEVSSGTINGTVVGRSIEYSIDGLICDLTVSPGASSMEEYVGDETIAEFTATFGEEE